MFDHASLSFKFLIFECSHTNLFTYIYIFNHLHYHIQHSNRLNIFLFDLLLFLFVQLPSEMIMSNSGDDSTEAYVEITLNIFDDSVAIHSIQGESLHEDAELYSLVKKALENKSSSSISTSLFGNSCKRMKKVSQELKRQLASLTKTPSVSRRFKQTNSAAAHALKGLKLVV